jgi:hypothetical protein
VNVFNGEVEAGNIAISATGLPRRSGNVCAGVLLNVYVLGIFFGHAVARDVPAWGRWTYILLMIATGFVARSGMHLQDGMYEIGVDDTTIAGLLSGDSRFSVYTLDSATLSKNRDAFDLAVIRGQVLGTRSEKSRSALRTLNGITRSTPTACTTGRMTSLQPTRSGSNRQRSISAKAGL